MNSKTGCTQFPAAAIAVVASALSFTAFAGEPQSSRDEAGKLNAAHSVVDRREATSLDLMLFVHRADLPLRPAATRQKESQ
jgi:hypothetical protein